MTESTVTRSDLNELEQTARDAEIRAQQAREQLAVQQSALEAERAQRLQEFRAQRYANYDRAQTVQGVRAARDAFRAALAQDPVVQAFIAWQAAEQHAHTAMMEAHTDALALHGQSPFGNLSGEGPAVRFLPDVVRDEVELALRDRVNEWQDERSRAETTAVFGAVPRTPAEAAAFAAEQTEAERRRRAVMSPGNPTSVDVTDMSEAERKALGLPPGIVKDPFR
jgi:hypothetical protein